MKYSYLLFLEALAEQRPLVLVFEDLHWADEGLLDFVDYLAGWRPARSADGDGEAAAAGRRRGREGVLARGGRRARHRGRPQ
jgi:hypothetical protein